MPIYPISLPSGLEWKMLDGLLGEGPPAKHFYFDRPSPWREGIVIQFSYPDGSGWVGNFASDHRRPAEILHWSMVNLIVVLIRGDLYLIDECSPDQYTVQEGVNNFRLDAGGQCLFVADHARVRAYGSSRRMLWETGPLGGYDAYIERIHPDVLDIDIQVEMGEPRKIVRVRSTDGFVLGAA